MIGAQPHGGVDGLDDLRTIIAGAPAWLAPGGSLVLEMAPTQISAVADLARVAGAVEVDVRRDLSGRDRAIVARFAAATAAAMSSRSSVPEKPYWKELPPRPSPWVTSMTGTPAASRPPTTAVTCLPFFTALINAPTIRASPWSRRSGPGSPGAG